MSILPRFGLNFYHEEIFHSLRFMIKLQYKEDQEGGCVFDIVLYDSLLHYTMIKKITHEHLSGFIGLCILFS